MGVYARASCARALAHFRLKRLDESLKFLLRGQVALQQKMVAAAVSSHHTNSLLKEGEHVRPTPVLLPWHTARFVALRPNIHADRLRYC